jgi:hypothetical protein
VDCGKAVSVAIASLNKNKPASYKDIAAAAAAKKLKVFPVMFGRAQGMLGIIKQAKRCPGRPRKNASPVLDSTLKSIIAIVKSGELEKARYHKALGRIQRLVADALA